MTKPAHSLRTGDRLRGYGVIRATLQHPHTDAVEVWVEGWSASITVPGGLHVEVEES